MSATSSPVITTSRSLHPAFSMNDWRQRMGASPRNASGTSRLESAGTKKHSQRLQMQKWHLRRGIGAGVIAQETQRAVNQVREVNWDQGSRIAAQALKEGHWARNAGEVGQFKVNTQVLPARTMRKDWSQGFPVRSHAINGIRESPEWARKGRRVVTERVGRKDLKENLRYELGGQSEDWVFVRVQSRLRFFPRRTQLRKGAFELRDLCLDVSEEGAICGASLSICTGVDAGFHGGDGVFTPFPASFSVGFSNVKAAAGLTGCNPGASIFFGPQGVQRVNSLYLFCLPEQEARAWQRWKVPGYFVCHSLTGYCRDELIADCRYWRFRSCHHNLRAFQFAAAVQDEARAFQPSSPLSASTPHEPEKVGD
ncbi:hypothetical protein C8R46DRAFT_1184576 [Mycena filopes]|nr:hypothetical protein C8R46DRAFT_1184576 [Mycena filopes]